uniref:Uncharacterized protein n=1 Tax=Rhizophora mucronata TaxID=61149 RepID=A0A2P2N183_RHIMU
MLMGASCMEDLMKPCHNPDTGHCCCTSPQLCLYLSWLLSFLFLGEMLCCGLFQERITQKKTV